MKAAHNSRLPDGRPIRALEGQYVQKEMFALAKNRLYSPANETIMTVKEYEQCVQSGAYEHLRANSWKTSEYGFYRKGFENRDLSLGDKIVYFEEGVTHTLIIPDVPVKLENGETIGLRHAGGMGVIRLEKLQYDEDRSIVSVTSDFDPAIDAKVVDIMRPRSWAFVDADGYPLRTKPSQKMFPVARYSFTRNADELSFDSTGWHGSISIQFFQRGVAACEEWRGGYGVAVVRSRAKVTVKKYEESARISGSVIEAAESEYEQLSKILDPEKVTAYRQLLDSVKKS